MRSTKTRTRCGLIEIGTNSIKCLIADVVQHQAVTVHFAKQTTRIGEGLDAQRRISTKALTRSLDAIDVFGRRMRRARCDHVFCFSTYALRRASNSPVVVRRIARRLGSPVRVLTGREEARFAYVGAHDHLGLRRPNAVLVDIGGGSTEIVVARRGRIAVARSLPIGALHLTERFAGNNDTAAKALSKMAEYIERKLSAALRSAGVASFAAQTFDMVGSGGTVTTAARMIDGLPRIRSGDLRRLLQRCSTMPLWRRRRLRGLEPDRADIIVAGLSVLLAVMRLCDKRVLFVSPGGVRAGVLVHLIEKGFRW